MSNDRMIFAEEESHRAVSEDGSAWKVMIVDDNEAVHGVTRMVLDDFTFEGCRVNCLSAYSGLEAEKMIIDHPDTAVMLLDVVMETGRAGLDVARYVREKAQNQIVRIILRTGQPGVAPEQDVVNKLDINDYRNKTELTSDRLVTALTTAIRSYRDIMTINEARRGLHLLAMSVAHQIRNRTIAIAGFANLIRRKESTSPDIAEHLNTIMDESLRLESMVGDVTRYASVEAAHMRYSSIRDLLETAMENVESSSESKGSAISWDVFAPDQTVLVDPVLFVTAFEALLQNAVDFSPENPHVGIKVSPGRLTCIISITDQGTGIGKNEMPHIFDPFYSIKPDGSGMGLAIVKKVAMEHQWDVYVDSEVGKGTTVRVVIPRREITGLA